MIVSILFPVSPMAALFRLADGLRITPDSALRALVSDTMQKELPQPEQLSLFSPAAPKHIKYTAPGKEDILSCLTGQM